MRTAEASRLLSVAESDDDLLTTGEAAALLGSTRQHVVNLVSRGDLPSTLVGTHRRVRRADVEQIQHSSRTPTRDQRRSLWLGHAIAGRIVADPELAVTIGRQNVDKMLSTQRGAGRRWLLRWSELLSGPVDDILVALTSNTTTARELRQNNPFAGLLDEATRQAVFAATRTSPR